ncbi:hypothetical protein, partial [Desulfovibrio desulfuricans]|uniref:hypothetical protein n=1 Tax=Desulfovibrio desulfuricans TaxID=876 RepID=UPI001C036F94
VFHQQNALAAKLLPDGAFRILSADSGRFVVRGRVFAQHGSEAKKIFFCEVFVFFGFGCGTIFLFLASAVILK